MSQTCLYREGHLIEKLNKVNGLIIVCYSVVCVTLACYEKYTPKSHNSSLCQYVEYKILSNLSIFSILKQ